MAPAIAAQVKAIVAWKGLMLDLKVFVLAFGDYCLLL